MIYNNLLNIFCKIWPDLEHLSEDRQKFVVGDMLFSVCLAPLAVGGIIWLSLVTDLQIFVRQWPMFALFFGIILLFDSLNFFMIIEMRSSRYGNRYGSAQGSFASTMQWTAVFLFGPTALWLSIIISLINILRSLRKLNTLPACWNLIRDQTIELFSITVAHLVGLIFYQQWGGKFPIADLTIANLLPAIGAIAIDFCLVLTVWLFYTLYVVWAQRLQGEAIETYPTLMFLLRIMGLTTLAHPYAIILAGLYVDHGLTIFLFLCGGLFLVAFLARQFSLVVENNRQHSRQLEKLEHLGRDIINSFPEASTLPLLLKEHVPSMFPSVRIAIWLIFDKFVLIHPEEWEIDIDPVWTWAETKTQAEAFLEKDNLPWLDPKGSHNPIIVCPVLDVESVAPIGFIYIELHHLAQPWERKAMTSLFSAVHTLAAQIASALHQVDVYAETLEYQTTLQELEFAGKIQASFLPNEFPNLEGWELAVTLLPARETSGDFFDFIQLPDDKVGILIADVADKGVGAALYMALSRTLIRTYALEYDAQPDIVLFSANERILQDARANLFVTAFYCVLDQRTGLLTYANAGHNPPLLLSPKNGGSVQALMATGMPIGIDGDASWTQATIQIEPGDSLILYTDGIPDAQSQEGEFFKERQLIAAAQKWIGYSAQELLKGILEEVQEFVGTAPQFDDITLLVLMRGLEYTSEEPEAKLVSEETG
ncbi:MAG TPA: PP2C family protein-serine/threonine phosphatase [Anaerolineales bacterium]|nr:PP2C family protein-serine/threonine phosphatase [Anaerolineales bacterium]